MADDRSDRTRLLVIGGGPGGYAAAFRAADVGLDVTLVSDEERLGGVCLLRGCIPSKALLEVAELIDRSRAAEASGIRFAEPDVDLDALRDWTHGVVTELTDGLEAIVRRRGIERITGRARFDDSRHVVVTDGDDERRLEFDHALIATGSRPVPLPGTDFGDRIMDSAAALGLPDVPERLLVVGGGYVGLELGTVYATLGTAVTVVEMTDRLVPMVDDDLVGPLRDDLEDRFEALRLDTTVTELEAHGDRVRAVLESGGDTEEHHFDRALVAIGRRPNTDDLGLDRTDVQLDDDGFVVVDERRTTTDPRISAIGDAAGGELLAHEAMHEGQVAAEAVAGEPAAFDARAVPAVIYTDPQIAWCGVTERQAGADGREVVVTRFPWRASGRALTLGGRQGMTKLVLEPGTDRVLGVGIVGRAAESMIAEGVLAVEMGAVAADLARSIAPHPTLSETVHEAAQLHLRRPVHVPPPTGDDE